MGEPSRSPALCLVCGMMICSQCYCCLSEMKNSSQALGACSQHKRTCGKGVGLFLRVRDCEVLMLYGQGKGCYMPSPYLDEYGEPDRGFRSVLYTFFVITSVKAPSHCNKMHSMLVYQRC